MSLRDQPARSSLNSFVPPKTQSFARGIAYMSGASSQTIAQERLDFRHDRDLPAMRLKIGIMNKLARADAGAIDHKIEFWINIFEFFEADVCV